MGLQHRLVFAVLVLETLAFIVLSVPLYNDVKHRLVRHVVKHPAFANMKTLLYVVAALIVMLFADSLNKVLSPPVSDGGAFDKFQILFKKAYNERNFYLAGATLLMAYVVAAYYSLLVRFLESEGKLRSGPARVNSADSSTPSSSIPARRSERAKDR